MDVDNSVLSLNRLLLSLALSSFHFLELFLLVWLLPFVCDLLVLFVDLQGPAHLKATLLVQVLEECAHRLHAHLAK